jgi:hypothetical protein
MPLLPPKEQTTAKAFVFSGGSLLKNEGAPAWKMLWPKGNPAAANLVNIIVCLWEHEGVRLRVVVLAFGRSQVPKAGPGAPGVESQNRV